MNNLTQRLVLCIPSLLLCMCSYECPKDEQPNNPYPVYPPVYTVTPPDAGPPPESEPDFNGASGAPVVP